MKKNIDKEQLMEIKKELQEKSDQVAVANMKPLVNDIDTDWRLAYYFYYFLNGKTDKLPDYKFIDSIVNDTKDNTISIGYGIDVEKLPESGDLQITSTEPITDITTRYDRITKDKYEAYVVSAYSKALDPDKFPRFEKRRVEAIQQYLRDYSLEKSSSRGM